jgi:hypothetical protein
VVDMVDEMRRDFDAMMSEHWSQASGPTSCALMRRRTFIWLIGRVCHWYEM